MTMVQFDPAVHEGRTLYELQDRDAGGGVSERAFVPAGVTFEDARLTPWYYVVDEDEPTKAWQDATSTWVNDAALRLAPKENKHDRTA